MSTPWSRTRAQVLVPAALLVLVITLAFGWLATHVRSSPARPDRQVVIASGVWQPYVGPDLDAGGPVTRIVTEALAAQGYQAEVRWSTWGASLSSARRGSVAATFPFVGTSNRRDDFLVSDPIVDFDYVLFARRVHGRLPSLVSAADIHRLRVGMIDGYEYWPELTAAVGASTTFATSRDAFDALARGTVDLVPEGRQPGMALVRSGAIPVDSERIGFVPPRGNPLLGATRPLSLLMPKLPGNESFMDDFNRGLAEVEQTDDYRDAVATLESGVAPVEVTLDAAPGTRGVRLRTSDGRWLLTPAGTTARVVSWPRAFVRPVRRPPSASAWLRVKLLTGPSAGRLLDVRAEDVVVSP